MSSLLSAVTGFRNGVYRIVQRKDDGTEANASLGTIGGPNQTSWSLVMDASLQASDINWKVTRKAGTMNNFTIVPKTASNGETIVNKNNAVCVERSTYESTWNLDCVEILTYKEDEDTIETRRYFRIYEAGTKRCWRTNDKSHVLVTDAKSGRAPASEMYEIIDTEDRTEPPVSVSSTRSVRAYASNATVVRTYYFGTQISDENLRYIPSMQLETDARNQGWASNPNGGSWSWFEVAIFSTQPYESQMITENQIKLGSHGSPLTWVSHRVPITSQYTTQQGIVFGKDHEIWQHVNPGDYIGVLACAQYPCWLCEGRSGKLNFQ